MGTAKGMRKGAEQGLGPCGCSPPAAPAPAPTFRTQLSAPGAQGNAAVPTTSLAVPTTSLAVPETPRVRETSWERAAGRPPMSRLSRVKRPHRPTLRYLRMCSSVVISPTLFKESPHPWQGARSSNLNYTVT